MTAEFYLLLALALLGLADVWCWRRVRMEELRAEIETEE